MVKLFLQVQEERFSRKKHDSGFPKNAVKYCLKSNNLNLRDIQNIVYYEKPLLTFERLLETYIAVAPRGARSFYCSNASLVKRKIIFKVRIKKTI